MQRADWYFLITLTVLLVLTLAGCSRKTPVEQAFQGVNNNITAIEHALPAECRTEDINAKLSAVREESNKAQVACETKIKEYKTKYDMTKNALFGIIFLILGVFFIKSKKIF